MSPSPTTTPPAPTPLPSGVVDPQQLMQRVKGMTGIVLRIDDMATKLMSGADYMGPRNIPGPFMNVPATVWVVAVVGDIAPNFGVMPRPSSQCALFAYRADTGEVWSTAEGSLSVCQPYFARSLTPPDAPLRCAPVAYDNGLPSYNPFSRTRPGSFGFTAVRDDSWR